MSKQLNLFFDPTSDTSWDVKHRNFFHMAFIIFILISCVLLIVLIFLSYNNFWPFNGLTEKTFTVTNLQSSPTVSDYDRYFNNVTGEGIPFIVVTQAVPIVPPAETYCTFIRVGVQIFERINATVSNPVTSVHWCKYRTFQGNNITNSNVNVINAIPYIFLVTGKNYYAKYYYEIANASAHVYASDPLCENVLVSEINTVVKSSTEIITVVAPSIFSYPFNITNNPLLPIIRPIINFYFITN